MSIDSRKAPKTPAAHPGAELVEYHEFLLRQLSEARGRIKSVDVATGAAILVTGAASYVFTVTILDQLFVLSTVMRLLLLGVFAGATIGYLLYAVVLPSLRRVSLLYAASTIEHSDARMKNSLVNWLQLREKGEEIPAPILQAIETRAAEDLSRIDLGDAIQSRDLLRSCYVLAGVVVVFCAYSLVTTKDLAPSLRRVLFPMAEIAPPTNTRLHGIQPEDVSITAGEKITFSAYAAGRRPDRVTVYYRTEGAVD
ncbi:MAG: hypothetical protein ACRDD1_22385, partial [Planctomycetia bacterium]